MNTTPVNTNPLNPASLEHVPVRTLTRRKKAILLSLLCVLLLFTSLVLGFHGFIAWTLARPTIAPLSSNPAKAIGLSYEDVTFPSSTGNSNLNGWYIPAGASDKTVIFSHGYGGNREELWVPIYSLAKKLHESGYNVLMFDYGYVQPDNQRIVTAGIQESKELLGAVNYIKNKGSQNIYVWGFSMGAGTALQAALNTQDIDGMILDSSFLLSPDTLYHNMKQYVNIPKFPSLPLVRLFFPMLNGVSMNQIPYQSVTTHEYPMPIYFIHGDEDERAPYGIAEQIYKNQSNQASNYWVIPAGKHELIYSAKPDEYITRTFGFLQTIARPQLPEAGFVEMK
ncbi:alpha/beta hydrolase [Paenibacillus lutrae]|uniref:Alpha/beta fold hydrolase n=1 Tax=Paenibacillus lutrae TaxID=2078573 RepID=A0A7X3FHK8_9BACL|nr:alpha/beta hydrolase [Paenibacillus lutrae]MVO99770.1 alpha/beta fold hydrolase [Paenibacillus lutrae]